VRHQSYQISGKWWRNAGIIPSVYRLVTFIIAAAQITFFTWAHYSLLPPFILIMATGTYSLLRVLIPLRWHQWGNQSYILLGLDLAICLFLVTSTGNLYSPFLLYSLVPVLTAGLVLDWKATAAIAVVSGGHVFAGHLWNPFFPISLSLAALTYFLIYMLALSLVTILPYLVNPKLRQRLQLQDILSERYRLSREIHDSMGQTIAAMRWQTELINIRLLEIGIDLPEVREMVKLAVRAHQDIKECLVLLRSYTGDGSFIPHLRDYISHLKQRKDINFILNDEGREIHLEPLVEFQLLRICQEALFNVTKHADAHNVQINVQSIDDQLMVSVVDDGRGFDALAHYRDRTNGESQGLVVMEERAESVGGKLRVLSMPGHGTEIQVEVPAYANGDRLWLKR
jgi:signal transduction histidine kinase